MPEFFPSMDVRKVNLDGRHADGRNGVAKRNAGVGISSGVDHDYVESAFGFLNPANQFALLIGLPKLNRDLELHGMFANFGLNIRQSLMAINFWFARAEQIQVWAVQKEDFHWCEIIWRQFFCRIQL